MGEDDKPNWPPKTETDWDRIKDAMWKVDMMWVFMRPLNSVRQDWRVIVLILAALAWFNRPGVIEALGTVFGGTP